MARIYFEEVKNYEAAIELYSFLKNQGVSESERQFYSFRIALAYFEVGKWSASLKQVEEILSTIDKNEDKEWINKLFLKARILLVQEQYKEAEQVFKRIQQANPVFFEENKIFLYLSFIHESRREFHQAVSELEKFQSTSDFLMSKIKRLKVRQSNQPGAAIQ